MDLRNRINIIILFVFILLFHTLGLYSGTTGKIVGIARDKNTGEGLPGVNIVIVETTLGAATDKDGRYFIINIPAGSYKISASMIGYKRVDVEDFKVFPDFTSELNFEMEITPIEGEVVVVRAERPLVRKDQTATVRIVTDDEIKNLPTRGYQRVVTLQSGVVEYGGGLISIRGGRTNETAYYVDGFSQQDPLTGVSSTIINNNAIDQISIITGGFNAEYGRIMSGVVNVITKGGTRDYHGSFEAISDEFSGDWIKTNSFGYNLYSFSLSGPVVKNNDRFLFFISGEMRNLGDRFPKSTAEGRLPHNSLSGFNWQAKLNAKITDTINGEFATLGSKENSDIYIHSYKYNLEHAPKREDSNNSYYFRLSHALSPNSFYKLSLNHFYTESHTGDGKHFKNISEYGREMLGRQFDDEALFYLGDDPGTIGDEGNLWNDYFHRESSYYGLKGDFTSQVNSNHQIQTGFDSQRHTLRMYHHLFPSNVYEGNVRKYQDLDVYGYDETGNNHLNSGLNGAKHPVTASLYFQDKIEYEGLVINAGLRYDYINPDTEGLKDELKPLGDDSKLDPEDLTTAKVVNEISPRLGVGFPITDRTVFHFNYGKFLQQPNLQHLYVSYKYLGFKIPFGGYFFPFGNPNLKPEETTAYEAGVAHQLGENVRIGASVYYKDVKNLVQVGRITGEKFSFDSYRNTDFGTIKGIDLSVTLRRIRNISGNLAYSLSFAEGTGSSPITQRNIAWTGSQQPKLTAPLDFDQRHKLSLNFDVRWGINEGPEFLGKYLLGNGGINVVMNAGSGFPYTPTFTYNEVTLASVSSQPSGSINSNYGPWTFQIDAKINKIISVYKLNFNFYVWILNLLNRKNPISFYSSTGSPGTNGWLVTPNGQEFIETFGEEGKRKYLEKERNPNNYNIPRLVRFGILINF